MPLLLIGVRESRWIKGPAERLLNQGDVPADPLGDLRTTDNQLSVWEILPDRSNLKRIVRALAVGKDEVQPSGWVVFPSEVLGEVGIEAPVTERRQTRDDGVNDCHRNLVDLSGNRIVALSRALITNGDTGQFLKKDMLAYIDAGIIAHELKEDLLPTKIQEQLGKHRKAVTTAGS